MIRIPVSYTHLCGAVFPGLPAGSAGGGRGVPGRSAAPGAAAGQGTGSVSYTHLVLPVLDTFGGRSLFFTSADAAAFCLSLIHISRHLRPNSISSPAL